MEGPNYIPARPFLKPARRGFIGMLAPVMSALLPLPEAEAFGPSYHLKDTEPLCYYGVEHGLESGDLKGVTFLKRIDGHWYVDPLALIDTSNMGEVAFNAMVERNR